MGEAISWQDERLRPCPFCGTTPLYVEKYVYDNRWTQYRVGCEQHDCDAQPTVDYHYFTEQEAIDAWNNQAVAIENDSLKADNAKLRELVLDACGNGHPDKSCGDCEIMDECHAEIEEAHKKGNGRWNTRCLFECRIEDRMRELGIEVAE